MLKQALKTLGVAVGLASAMSANAYVVGGINFGSALSSAHLETATLAQTLVTGDNQNALSYGYVSTVNGNTSYCASAGFCGLYYITTLNNSQNFTGNKVEFMSATVQIFFTNTFTNLLDQNSVANLATIQAMTPWLTLSGHGNLGAAVASSNAVQLVGTGDLVGSALSATGKGLFDVNLGAAGLATVKNAFNTNLVADAAGGFADVELNSSFSNVVLNDHDVADGLANGCADGSAVAGAWCYQGTTNLRGKLLKVPEPASVALVGLSLGLTGLLSRRRRSAAK